MKNSDKLNAFIKKSANGSNRLSLHLHQMFFFEHVLMRIEKSSYRDNIILKGGVLLSSIIGVDMRTTKDIDATLKSLPLTKNNIISIFEDILSIELEDGCKFKIESVKEIRLEDEYNGYRINVYGIFDKLKTNFFIEITTGDIITPREIAYKYNSIFEDRKISILAYTIETIIAEKLHAIISKNIITTRAKDFYDLYILINKHRNKINTTTLAKAVVRTFESRNTKYDIEYLKEIVEIMESSEVLENNYIDYSKNLQYAKNITYEDTIVAIKTIISILELELEVV